MDDKFKEYLAEHREEFDSLEPDPGIWNRIEADIRVRPGIKWKVMLSRAAAVVLIFAASYAVNEFIHRSNSKGTGIDRSVASKKGKALPGLSETEAYYTSLVNQKLDELKPIMANCPSLREELNVDMSELDSVYVDLKADLKDNMANQEVIEAIIENYRLKIRILEDLLKEMEPIGNECISKNDAHAL